MLHMFRSTNKRMKMLWWALAIVTIVTFVGGFVVILGSGLSSGFSGTAVNAAGSVNGEPISREQYAAALDEQRAQYRQQYGVEPAERDVKMIELQAWRNVVNRRLLEQRANAAGLRAYDPEVVLGLRTAPPQVLMSAPLFQTEGQFDASKYQQAMQDPNLNWSPFESIMRAELPVRKLQERLLASLKVSEPELRQAYRDASERVSATVLQILPAYDQQELPEPTDAEIQALYDRHKGYFAAPRRAQAEVMMVPKRFGELELQAARELAASLVQRARAGEDFAVLARDYSEGPAAEEGGVVDRLFLPSEFGTDLEAPISALAVGGVTDPFQDGGRFMIFKLLERQPGATPANSAVKVAQIIIRIRPDSETLRQQYEELQKVRRRAEQDGLSRAATEIGASTSTTTFFGYQNPPPALYTVPEAVDWALGAKKGDVSPVYQGIDEWAIVQVVESRAAGPSPREDVADQLRQMAEIDARVELAKPRADEAQAALARGKSLEEVGRELGINPFQITDMSRRSPDGRVASVPEVMGAMYGAPLGKVVGPIRGINGWYFVRVNGRSGAEADSFEVYRNQLVQQLLQRKQQAVLTGLALTMREGAEVKDQRSEPTRATVQMPMP